MQLKRSVRQDEYTYITHTHIQLLQTNSLNTNYTDTLALYV